MAVKERLKKFIDYLNERSKIEKKGKITTSDFCIGIGASPAFVSSMRKSIGPEMLESIALKYPELNITWLLFGNGEMLLNSPSVSEIPDDIFQRKLCEMFRNEEIFPASVVHKKNDLIHRLYEEIGGLKARIVELEIIRTQHLELLRDLDQKRASSA